MLIVPFDDDEKEESWCDMSLMRYYYVSVGVFGRVSVSFDDIF